jgi:hypothetical protein
MCPSCQKNEWFFVDPKTGEEVVRKSHYDAIVARRQLGATGARIDSRKKVTA